ncbi:TetR/AcrR family transcriptional regulator [Solicola sp. PLA-1-18]|uniref:TetR/AcrR family transcriptional regulator n=1 Tax=Solicola sp. PLA-1-18 TaxID=3380532 RepID=UPI003B7E922E
MTQSTRPVTRAERQAQTRETLILTARRMFLADGYGATSLDKVALEAGFSKGAVYSNFKNKEELCLAVLDSIQQRQVDEVAAAFTEHQSLDDRLAAFGRWARERIGQPRWTALEVEFGSVARQSPFVADALRERHKATRRAIADLVDVVLADAGVEISMTSDQAATALLSLGIGLGAQRSLDPDVDVDVFTATLRAVMGLPPA